MSAGHAGASLWDAAAIVAALPPQVYAAIPHVVVGLFVFALGACLGSFANVVIYRLPAGISVVSPPSRCPTCGVRLGWRENLPVLGWLLLRGRCRACGVRISSRYLIIEAIAGALFLWLYLILYVPAPTVAWWGELGGPWWSRLGPLVTLPAFLVQGILLIALLVMARIDARTFTIPIQVPNAVVGIALVLWPLQAVIPAAAPARVIAAEEGTWWPMPVVEGGVALGAFGAAVGLAIMTGLLWCGRIRPSFADYDEYAAPAALAGRPSNVPPEPAGSEDVLDPEGPRVELLLFAAPLAGVAVGAAYVGWTAASVAVALVAAGLVVYAALDSAAPGSSTEDAPLAEYPHARREVRREVVFLLPAILLAVVGWLLGERFGIGPVVEGGRVGPAVALASCVAGYLAAGGLVWAVRIVATLGFGREAMGIGDVHLLAAAGAALGWVAPLWAFVLAPFAGIAWLLATMLARLRGGSRSPIQQGSLPFGPHLAVAVLLVMALSPGIDDAVRFWLGTP
ncbi:MAG TPA: prepilin peptidase [Phycisphaerales bacterium]|nr:prepilin peptidase [Phycisphaerales bacterium]HMP36558.1 prepilin peptidase [Phycisphaerales bacterium]